MSDWKEELFIRDLEFYSRAILEMHRHLKVVDDISQSAWFRSANATSAVEWARIAATQIANLRRAIK